MSDSRTRNSAKNVTFGFATQVIVLLVNFIARTIFIHYLGAEMLGISGLYTNILSLLSMAELGFGNAIIYSMYKPVKHNDEKQIAALLNYYRRVYIGIIGIITVAGCILIPFLPYIVRSNLSNHDLIIYYALFLINTICSYTFVYKTSIINAQQKMYITKVINVLVLIVQLLAQTATLALSRSYVAFLVVQIICTLLNNILCSIIADRMYPYIKQRASLHPAHKKEIRKNVSSIFLYKVSGTILNNTDNIFISMLVSTVTVGFYSNYYMVVSALSNIIFIFFNAITASVGNLMTEKDIKKQESVFAQLNYICFIITGFCAIELITVFNDFITMWVGSEYLMDNNIMLIIVVNFYIYTMQNPVWTFRDTTGLFKDAKNDTILLAITNIILSLILGKIWGVFGILLATAISRLLITSWHQPYLLYKKIFKHGYSNFISKQLFYIGILLISAVPSIFINQVIPGTTLFFVAIKVIIVAFSTLFIFIVATHRTSEFTNCLNRIKQLIKSKKD